MVGECNGITIVGGESDHTDVMNSECDDMIAAWLYGMSFNLDNCWMDCPEIESDIHGPKR